MLKKNLIVVSVLTLLIVGCSSDQRYKREVDGNDNYLQAAELRPLTVPQGTRVPTDTGEFYVYKAANEGSVGKDLDIRPPALPLPTIADSYATYDNGVVTLDAPDYSGFWSQIPTILQYQNIAIVQSDSASIKTGTRLVSRDDELQPVEASYLLQRRLTSGREYITVELTSLKRMGQEVTSTVESQRYTVEFFNMLMNKLSSSGTN